MWPCVKHGCSAEAIPKPGKAAVGSDQAISVPNEAEAAAAKLTNDLQEYLPWQIPEGGMAVILKVTARAPKPNPTMHLRRISRTRLLLQVVMMMRRNVQR